MPEDIESLTRRLKRLERDNRVLAAKLERSEDNRSRLEDQKERHETLLRTVIGELREAQEAVQEANHELERRVDERTRDLTLANAALVDARDSALAANRAKSYFLATMSHELRTPLNVIIGYAELLQELIDEGEVPDTVAAALALSPGARVIENDAAQDDLGRITGAARHLLALIDDILDLSKIEAGAAALSYSTIELDGFIDELANTGRTLARPRGNRFSLHHGARRASLVSDRTKLRQIVHNLLSNAAKFTRDGEIQLITRARDERLELAVRDTGIGIAQEHFDKLFQPFSQVEAAANRQYEGTGLGLALTRKYCRLLGGEVSVQSEFGVGSTFTVSLPLAPAATAAEG
ncbi:MAG: hypothetical protein H6713_12365 [Myxococcales bacterium]|nr:hypothetical protein [Myxococcales bacterium]